MSLFRCDLAFSQLDPPNGSMAHDLIINTDPAVPREALINSVNGHFMNFSCAKLIIVLSKGARAPRLEGDGLTRSTTTSISQCDLVSLVSPKSYKKICL